MKLQDIKDNLLTSNASFSEIYSQLLLSIEEYKKERESLRSLIISLEPSIEFLGFKDYSQQFSFNFKKIKIIVNYQQIINLNFYFSSDADFLTLSTQNFLDFTSFYENNKHIFESIVKINLDLIEADNIKDNIYDSIQEELKQYVANNINSPITEDWFIKRAYENIQLCSVFYDNEALRINKHYIEYKKINPLQPKIDFLESLIYNNKEYQYSLKSNYGYHSYAKHTPQNLSELNEAQLNNLIRAELNYLYSQSSYCPSEDISEINSKIKELTKETRKLKKESLTIFTIDGKDYHSFEEVSKFNFLILNDVPLKSHEAKLFLERPLDELKEFVTIHSNLKNF